MTLTATEFRAKLYRVLDQVLETGEPVDIERKGKILQIVPAVSAPKMERLVRRESFLHGDPDSFIHLDWSDLWNP